MAPGEDFRICLNLGATVCRFHAARCDLAGESAEIGWRSQVLEIDQLTSFISGLLLFCFCSYCRIQRPPSVLHSASSLALPILKTKVLLASFGNSVAGTSPSNIQAPATSALDWRGTPLLPIVSGSAAPREAVLQSVIASFVANTTVLGFVS